MKAFKQILVATATALLMVSFVTQANTVKPYFPVMKDMKACKTSRAFIYGDRLFLYIGQDTQGKEQWFSSLPSEVNPRVWTIDNNRPILYTAMETTEKNTLKFYVQGLESEVHCKVRNLPFN